MESKLENEEDYAIAEPALGQFKEQLALKYGSEQTTSQSSKTLTTLSLFSGCGGMDLGFEGDFLVPKVCVTERNRKGWIANSEGDRYVRLKPTKFKTAFANDILPDARNAWVHNFSNLGYAAATFHTESIVNLVKLAEQGHPVFPKKVDLVTGGFPCQDFSVAGKRKGFNSHRNHDGTLLNHQDSTEATRGKLYYWMKKVIELTKPKVFIAENVKGLANLDNVKEIIQSDFAAFDDNGYLVLNPQVLHAADYGISQSRQRIFFHWD